MVRRSSGVKNHYQRNRKPGPPPEHHSRHGRILLICLALLRPHQLRNLFSFSIPCPQTANVWSTNLNQVFGFNLHVDKSCSSRLCINQFSTSGHNVLPIYTFLLFVKILLPCEVSVFEKGLNKLMMSPGKCSPMTSITARPQKSTKIKKT